MLNIQEINDKKQWEEFLVSPEISYFPFFQSWNWGEVQKKLGFTIFRQGLFDGSKLVGVCQVVDIPAKRGHYLHLRHGPVLLKTECCDVLIHQNKQLARQREASFIRMSPLVIEDAYSPGFFKKRGAIKAPIHNMDAQVCWVLDITKSEEEILKGMRKTHRYLVKKSQTMNISISRATIDTDVNQFLKFYNDFSHRKGFVAHSGVKEEYEEFKKDNQVVLFMAEYEKKLISAAMIAFVGNTAIYRHSASDSAHRDIPASYLIQWEAIKEAKKRGKSIYNFWGISPTENKNHPWYGLSLFKTGFGGEKVEFVPAYDFPLNLKYWKAHGIDLFTKWKKGY